ncbi:14065_t:CDS:2, partial [Ambispora leptoticha]
NFLPNILKIEISILQQLQPQTRDALNNFLVLWNQDPLAANNKTERDLSTQHLENVDMLNNYFPDIVFDDLTFSIEPVEEELDVLSSQPDTDIVPIQDTENKLKKEADNSKDKIQKIHNNLKKALGSRRAARAWKCAE